MRQFPTLEGQGHPVDARLAEVSAEFHDPNRVSVAGLVPALAVAERAGLHEVVAERVAGSAGANVAVNVSVVVAGTVAGANRVEDPDVLGHGAMSRVLIGVQARTALGTRPAGLRVWAPAPAGRGHLLGVGKPRRSGLAVAGRGDQVAYLDIGDTIRETDGYAKQGATYGYSCQVPGLTETSKAGGLTDGGTPGVSGGAGGAVGEVPRAGIRTWSKTGPSNAWSGVAEIRFHHDHLPSPS